MDDAAGTSAVPPSEVEAQTPPPEQNVVISGKIVWQAIGAVLATLFLLWAINQARCRLRKSGQRTSLPIGSSTTLPSWISGTWTRHCEGSRVWFTPSERITELA